MGFFLAPGRLVGSKVHENQTPVDAKRTKKVGDFFDTRGPSSSRYRIRSKIQILEKNRKTVKERKERFKLTVKAKKVKYAQATRNKTMSNQQVLEGCCSKVRVCHKTPQGKAKLPRLAGERSPKELRGAVLEYVPSFESLCSEIDCPIDTLKKVLNFLSLNGVDGALITPRTSDSVVLLRRQLAEILFPDLRPPREPSLSPESKAKAMAAELYEDADAIEKILEGDRQAKR
ncbi:unknown protein [Seminavis robusta]|uniref:Uncharacterized protein n=1 Tax=Seminavis robusta TaxID=568900 RepID=A0A9N8H5A8_9STRA|nr:unknown protein [Seminavis robusta]|eukprot:Sro81_g043610.1 n/a (231) ;mRNA; f:119834-120681